MSERRRSLPGRRSFALAAALMLLLGLPFAGSARPQDATPPTVTITAPVAGATIDGVVRVTGRAKDRGGVASVKVTVDGGRSLTATGTSSWSVVLDAAGLRDGTHTITAQGTDRKGNVGVASVDVIVHLPQEIDSMPPAVTIDPPQAGTVLSGTVAFSGTATDEVGVVGLELQVDTDVPTSIAPSPSWSFAVDASRLSDGIHSVAVRATDRAGNTGSVTRSFTIDNGSDDAPSPSPEPTPEPTRIPMGPRRPALARGCEPVTICRRRSTRTRQGRHSVSWRACTTSPRGSSPRRMTPS